MPEFDAEQLKLIFRAVRYYQMNGTVTDSPEYRKCDAVLNDLWSPIYGQRPDVPCDI